MSTPRSPARFRIRVTLVALGLATLVGALTVFRAEALPPTIDLESTGADLTVFGDDPGDESGFSVAAGDIDGDTTADLIIGARLAAPGGRTGAGEVYVIYGGDTLPSTIELDSTSVDLTVFGDDAQDRSGRAVAAGDINGDGTDDLIFGANRASPAGRGNAGKVYVIYGGAGLPVTIDLDQCPVNPNQCADLTIYGHDAADHAGYSVAAGDIDGDTTADLIIGAFAADGSGMGTACGVGHVGDRCAAGETYVIYGGANLPDIIDLDGTPAGLTVYGDDTEDQSGVSVAAGDINGDTVDDLIIGAELADGSGIGTACGLGQVGDRCAAGETYVIYGGEGLPITIDLDSTAADLTVYGDSGLSGFPVGAGDIDGDTTEDLIIAARRASPVGRLGAGETYVVYGSPSLPAIIDLDVTSPNLTVYGDDADDSSGVSLGAGDIDGDTTDDLIIGAWGSDGPGTGPLTTCDTDQMGDRCLAGETYVIYGGTGLAATIDLDSTSADLIVYGSAAGDRLGISVAAGDIDGDGTGDLIIGAPGADGSGIGTSCDGAGDRCEVGETYVIFSRKPVKVGGVSEDPDLGALPVEAPGASGTSSGVLAGIAAAVAAGAVALGGAAWYARRRWLG